MAKKIRVTPFADIKWAHVFEPKPGFNPTDAPKYEITLAFDPSNEDWKALMATWEHEQKDAKGKNGNVKPECNKDGTLTGMMTVTFKTGANYPPRVLDMSGMDINACKIGNGSTGRVAYTTKPYTGLGGGITLYLSSVQIDNLEVYSDNPFASENLPF